MILSGMSAVMAAMLIQNIEPVMVQQPIQIVKEPIIKELEEPKKKKKAKKKKSTKEKGWHEEKFKVTAYCPCYICSEGYGRHTSTGARARSGHTIAVDPSVLPYGTHVLIEGKEYVAEDCGGGVNGNHIDMFVDTHKEALEWCTKYITVKWR